MIPLTPLQLLCGGWTFLPSPGAVFGEPQNMVRGVSATGIQWPTGVMEYGLAGAFSAPNVSAGMGLRRLGFSASLYENPADTVHPATATYEEFQAVAGFSAFRGVGVRVALETRRLSGVFSHEQVLFEGSVTHVWSLRPWFSLAGRLRIRLPRGEWGGGVRVRIAQRAVLQISMAENAWKSIGGCGGMVEDIGWLAVGSQVFPGWGTLWGVGGGFRLGSFSPSWVYLLHPYGRPILGFSVDWFPERGGEGS